MQTIDGWLLEGEHNIALKTLGEVILRADNKGVSVTCTAYKSYHAVRGAEAMFLSNVTVYPIPQREYPGRRAMPTFYDEELEDIFDFHCVAYHYRNDQHPKFVTGENREACINDLVHSHWDMIEPTTHLYIDQVLKLGVNEKEQMIVTVLKDPEHIFWLYHF